MDGIRMPRPPRRARRAGLLAGVVALVASLLVFAFATTASAAAEPALTLSVVKKVHVKVAWRFDALSTRAGSKLEIERSVDGDDFVRIKAVDRPGATGSYTDKNAPQGVELKY